MWPSFTCSSPAPKEPVDPFYAPTNLATRLRSNPQPRTPPAPSKTELVVPASSPKAKNAPEKESDTPKPSTGRVPPAPNQRHQRHASHNPTDLLAMVLLVLVIVLLLALKGASSGSAALSAQNAKLVEERGLFVVSLMDWSQRLLEAE